jgi:hypothetical protein
LRQSIKDQPPKIKTVIEEVKVPSVPEELLESLAELAARAEASADNLEQKIAQPVV